MRVDYDKDQLAYALANALKERDEANEELHKQLVRYDQLFDEAEKNRIERDEAREECKFLWDERDQARGELSLKQQTLTIAEGTLSDLRKQRDGWSAMCSRYKQERDIAEQDATNYHARIIELIAERDKTKQERDEARAALRKAIRFVDAYEPHSPITEADQNETLSIIRKVLEGVK